MQYVEGLENLTGPTPPHAVALGAFDGVHRGHHALLEATFESAREQGLPTGVLTFEPTPSEVLGRLGRPDVRLTLPEERRRLLERLGIDRLVVARFDEALRLMAPEDFARTVLVGKLGARVVVASETHTFGRRGSGNMYTLSALGCDLGFAVRVLPLYANGAGVISSTRIRELLWQGDVALAADLLGRLYTATGRVVTGDGLGRQLGFPTANVLILPPKLVPAAGVYAGWAWIREPAAQTPVPGAGPWLAGITVGPSPTFGNSDDARRIEAHLLDFSGELVGAEVAVAFAHRLRDTVAFPDVPSLIAQIRADLLRIRALDGDPPAFPY